MSRLALVVAVWTVVSVPVALLVGWVLARSGRSIADEAADYLRHRASPRPVRSRRPALAATAVVAVAALAAPAAALVHFGGGGDRSTPSSERAEELAPPVGVGAAPPTTEVSPPPPAVAPTPVEADVAPAPPVHEVVAQVLPSLRRLCTLLERAVPFGSDGVCRPTGAAPQEPAPAATLPALPGDAAASP